MRGSVVRRNLVARGACVVWQRVLQLLVQQTKLLLQQVDLSLLANDCLVERFDQVFGKCDFGFEFVQACFHQREDARNSGVTSFSNRG